MKRFFILFSLFTLSSIFSQSFTISEFEKCDTNNKSQKLVQDIQGQDRNVTILKLNDYNYLSFGDDVYKYNVVESENLILHKEKLLPKEASYCNRLLDTLRDINPSLLNINKNENGDRIVVEDGVTFQITLFKENCTVKYSSDSPDIYIKNKYPNFEERKKFLTVFTHMQSLFYDKEYEDLKKVDTIYLLYDRSDKTRNIKIDKVSDDNESTYSFLFSDGKSLNLRTLYGEVKTVKEKSVNNEVKIDLNTLDKYRFKAMFELLSNKKAIYIIDKESGGNKKKIMLARAYLDYNL